MRDAGKVLPGGKEQAPARFTPAGSPVTRTPRRRVGVVLLLAFATFLGWFMASSLRRSYSLPAVKPRLLTQNSSLFGVSFAREAQGWVVGAFGLIMRTDDGGTIWNKQLSGTEMSLAAVSAADPEHAFVAGSGGTILVTADGGGTWTRGNSGTTQQLLDVKALSAKEAWAVGAFGTMLSTTDSGKTWVSHSLAWDKLIADLIKENGPLTPNLNSVCFASAQDGWAAGEFGLILHTDDGGRTWNAQRFGSTMPQLAAIAFANAEEGWAAGQDGNLLHTTDGGKTWTAVELGTRRSFYALSVRGPHIVVAGAGVVCLSDDGGATWKRLKSLRDNVVLSAAAIRGDAAIAVGPGPTILPITFDMASN